MQNRAVSFQTMPFQQILFVALVVLSMTLPGNDRAIAQEPDIQEPDIQDPQSQRSDAAREPFPEVETFEYAMYQSPGFSGVESRVEVSDTPLKLWIEALARPETRLQRMSIDTLAVAHRRGMPGVEQVIPTLVEKLESEQTDPRVRLAAARALVVMDARQHEAALVKAATTLPAAFQAAIEPALVRWKSDRLVPVWLQRLTDRTAGQRSVLIALQGLAETGTDQAVEPMLQIINDPDRAAAVRLAAARSAGQLRSEGLNEVASDLIENASPATVTDLAAVALLENHSDESTLKLLESLLQRQQTAVQAAAVERIFQIDPQRVLPYVEQLIANIDSNVRWTLAQAMIATRSSDHFDSLASLLNDENPSLRRHVARSMVGLAQDPILREGVISETATILDGDAWRGCEQAIVVMVNLDYKPSGDRMVDLLGHPRGEVMMTSAWGLRRLALKQHLPAMLGRAQAVYDAFRSGEMSLNTKGAEQQVAQLFEAFGEMRFSEADALARNFIPRDFTLGEKARAAAIWALGWLYENDPQEDLAKQFGERLDDIYGLEPEMTDVRRMCAIGIGRMKAESALPMVRKHASAYGDSISQSCWWAIEQMTDEQRPPLPEPTVYDYHDWFLEPLDNE